MSDGFRMNKAVWYSVDILSGMLDPLEREAVRGDLAESGETGFQALCGVLGLVARRQVDLWRGWRPWLCLFGVVVPLGLLLSIASRSTADGTAIPIWIYANNSDWYLITNAGYWRELFGCLPNVALSYLTLSCWSWAGGFLLAIVARRTVWLNGLLLYCALLFVEVAGVPRYLGHFVSLDRGRDFYGNHAVFAVWFYRMMFPMLVQAALVILPSFKGMLDGRYLDNIARPFRIMLWAAMSATLATLAMYYLAWPAIQVFRLMPFSPMLFVVAAPTTYLFIKLGLRHLPRDKDMALQ